MISRKVTCALTVLLLASAVGHAAAPAMSKDERRFDNYIHCIGYTRGRADDAGNVGNVSAEADFRKASRDMEAVAKKLLPTLKVTSADMEERIGNAYFEIYMEADALSYEEFDAFDAMLAEHCVGVWKADPAFLDKELKW